MRPALVFVVPAFNAASTVADTVRSVLAQTRADVAALVIDDGSTDGTAALVLRMSAADPRVRLVRQENRGLAGARNRGVSELLAQLYCGAVCFLDADDVVEPRFAELMLPALEHADAAACAYAMVGPGLEDVGWVIRPGEHDLQPGRMLDYNPVAVGAVVVRLEALGRLGMLGGVFDESLPVHEDWDCWLRFTCAGGRWAVVPEALFSYRMQAGSMSSDLERMHWVGLQVIARHGAGPEAQALASRRWSIRHIARAAARGDAALAVRFAEGLELGGADVELLAGSLRWALCQEHQVGPSRVTADQQRMWLERVSRAMEGIPGAGAAAARLSLSENRWTAAARGLLSRLESGGTGVVYGLGRNGRELVASIERVLSEDLERAESLGLIRGRIPRLAWVDDDERAEAPLLLGRPLPRLRTDALSPRHVIVVTPDQGSGIVRRLRALGLMRVDSPESIAAPVAVHAP